MLITLEILITGTIEQGCQFPLLLISCFLSLFYKKRWKWLFGPGFGVCSTQLLVEIYNSRIIDYSNKKPHTLSKQIWLLFTKLKLNCNLNVCEFSISFFLFFWQSLTPSPSLPPPHSNSLSLSVYFLSLSFLFSLTLLNELSKVRLKLKWSKQQRQNCLPQKLMHLLA